MVGSHRDRPRAACFEQYESRVPLSAQPLTQAATEPSRDPALDRLDITGSLRRLHDDYQLTGAGQTVVVIDSGIAYDHPALGAGFGVGHKVVGGWDFTDERDADPYDDGPAGFHGTHVAGIIGSLDPRQIGVAPGADLVALRVFNDQGRGDFAWIEQALQWVIHQQDQFAHPITVVNLSIGLLPETQLPDAARVLDDEFAQLAHDGIFISVAAGNGYDSHPVPGLSYPASSPWVVPVGSVNSVGQLSGFSRRGARMLAAPGEDIQSTITDFLFDFNGTTDDWYAFSGTSQAAPFVAGAAVLVRQAMQQSGRHSIDQAAIYQVLRDTADWIHDDTGSYARINLLAAVESVLSQGQTATRAIDTTAETVATPALPTVPGVTNIDAIDLGTVGFRRLPDVVVSNQPQWYRLEMSQDGLFAVGATTEPGAHARLELFDSDGRRLTRGTRATSDSRVAWTAAQGQVFHVRLQGDTARAQLTFANLATKSTETGLTIHVPDDVKRVEITRGADVTISLDGLPFHLPTSTTSRLAVRVQRNDLVTIRASTDGSNDFAETDSSRDTLLVVRGDSPRLNNSRRLNLIRSFGSCGPFVKLQEVFGVRSRHIGYLLLQPPAELSRRHLPMNIC